MFVCDNECFYEHVSTTKEEGDEELYNILDAAYSTKDEDSEGGQEVKLMSLEWVVQGVVDVYIGANPCAEGCGEDKQTTHPKLNVEQQDYLKKNIEAVTKFHLRKLTDVQL
ncbi:hypothetical protein Tco_0665581 [Tanacetum coccineum]